MASTQRHCPSAETSTATAIVICNSLRERIAAEVELFLANGGGITVIDAGVSGENLRCIATDREHATPRYADKRIAERRRTITIKRPDNKSTHRAKRAAEHP